jgi:hypothetical protein
MISSVKNISNRTKWIALFSLWALQGIVAFLQFQVLSSRESSPAYFFVRGVLFAWIIINLILIVLVYKNASIWLKWQDVLVEQKIRDLLLIATSALVLFRVCLWIFQGLLAEPLTQQVGGYLSLLSPFLDLMGFVCLEIAILILLLNLRTNLDYVNPFKKFISTAIIIFVILGLITLIISITGLGILSSYKGDWQRGLPAVALLEWQILLAFIACLGMFLIESNTKIIEIPHFDLYVCIAIWLCASALWLSQPVIPNASALKPRGPNYEIYPFNDAQVYDEFAQSALVGDGFGDNKIPQRPLYVVFLIFSHALVGQGYNSIIFFQTLVFALFPVLLYLFGREFFGRPIGISIALLAIFRDYISNFVSPFTGNLSYSKLYLSEIPTAILLILFLLVAARWIKSSFPIYLGFLLGGILGSAMLIRTQVIVALPLIVLFGFLARPKEVKPLIKSMLLMLITIAFVVTPWLWRNWKLTGEFVFDSPESQTINLALRYSRLNGVEPQALPLPGESNVEYIARLNQIAKDAITSNLLGAAWGISNAFLNHAVNNILLFPIRNSLHSIDELWIPASAFWEGWEGNPNFSQSILITFYIFLFGLGITVAWIRNRWLGLLPLALNLAYNFWTSLALLSGQRFMVTMDWSIYLYYMVGLFTLLGGFLFALNSSRLMIVEWVKANPNVMTMPESTFRWQKFTLFGLLFLGIGLSLPLSEKVFPNKYPLLSQSELVAKLMASPSQNQPGFDSACLQKLTDADELSLLQGRAVYPRYYPAGAGEKFTDSVGYKVVDEGRLVFDLVGQAGGRYIFKTSQEPDFFPNASDITMISSKDGELLFVYVTQNDVERFYISDSFDRSMCP